MLLGNWTNFFELEECLTFDELKEMVNAKRKLDYQHQKFMAALKGIDLDKDAGQNEDPVQKLWNEVRAEQSGAASAEEYRFSESVKSAGFKVRTE